jgi:hypothetical protein
MADLLGSGDFPVLVDDPEAAAKIILPRVSRRQWLAHGRQAADRHLSSSKRLRGPGAE